MGHLPRQGEVSLLGSKGSDFVELSTFRYKFDVNSRGIRIHYGGLIASQPSYFQINSFKNW